MLENIEVTAEQLQQQQHFLGVFPLYEEIPEFVRDSLPNVLNQKKFCTLHDKIVFCIRSLNDYTMVDGYELISRCIPYANEFGFKVVSDLFFINFNEQKISKKDINDLCNISMLNYLTQSFESTFFIIQKILNNERSYGYFNPKLVSRLAMHKLQLRIEDGDIAYFFLYLKGARLAGSVVDEQQYNNYMNLLISSIKKLDERHVEWQYLLDYLSRFSEDTLEYNFRNLIIEMLQEHYNNEPFLQQLGVPSLNIMSKFYRDFTLMFSKSSPTRKAFDKFFLIERDGPDIVRTPCGTLPPLVL